jgi:tRNA threonylcarbamoyladenosine biosynthesis protein TsaE
MEIAEKARWRKGITCPTAESLEAEGEALARQLHPGTTLLLYGDLGAGKTTFTRGLARGWGVKGTLTSPSYALVQIHRGSDGRHLVHVDAYRLIGPEQLKGLLLDELVEPEDLLVIEWPERLGDALPKDALRIQMTTPPEGGRSMRLIES